MQLFLKVSMLKTEKNVISSCRDTHITIIFVKVLLPRLINLLLNVPQNVNQKEMLEKPG